MHFLWNAFPLLFVFFFLYSSPFYSQDSIPEAADLSEEKELVFQQFFFKALSEKSIGNYQKAIHNLENCHQLLQNDVAVFFEFSKNYLLLNNTLLAKEYIQRALKKDTENIWMLKHLVEIYVKESDFESAISIQEKLANKIPKERIDLVRLYILNKSFEKSNALMRVLDEEGVLSESLTQFNQKYGDAKIKEEIVVKKEGSLSELIQQFESDKSYEVLEDILKKSENNPQTLLKYSQNGMSLFPAQPYVYLMNGKALNELSEYKKAIIALQNGIDFVYEDALEANFYKQMATAYKGLGNIKEEKKYLDKYKKLTK